MSKRIYIVCVVVVVCERGVMSERNGELGESETRSEEIGRTLGMRRVGESAE